MEPKANARVIAESFKSTLSLLAYQVATFFHRDVPPIPSFTVPIMRPQEEDGLPQHLLSSLIAKTPWNEQVQSLAHLTELARSPSPQTLRQLRSLTPYFQSAIDNPRSALVRSVCETISTLAQALQAPFVEAVGNSLIPNLLNRSAVTKAVIRESCVNAARSMFEYGVEGVHFVTVRTLAEVLSDRRTAAPTRATAALFLGMILVDDCRKGLNHIIDVVATAIATGCTDPDESVRATSRENWRRLHALDASIAAEMLNSLPPHTVQLINRERDEFGDPFRADRDRVLRARTPGTTDMPVRSVPRLGLRPARLEHDEQLTQKKSRPHLRPPRRSVLPGAVAKFHLTSPDDSPPKRNEMHPVRRIHSPVTIDTQAQLHNPPSVDTTSPVDTASEHDSISPRAEQTPLQAKTIASASERVATEKSAVSAVSCSSGSHAGTPDNQTPLTNHASRMTENCMSSAAGTESSVSAVSSSSVSTPSPTPSEKSENAFQKIAGSGVSRGTNKDSPIKTPTSELHSNEYSLSASASPPDAKKGRLSFILGTNQTPRPRVYTPLPPISRIIEAEQKMQTFTPMDICTPMKNNDANAPLSGIVVKPLARALEDGLDEVAANDDKHKKEEPDESDSVEETEAALNEETSPSQKAVSLDLHVKDEEASPKNGSSCATPNSPDIDKTEGKAFEKVIETAEQTADTQEHTGITQACTEWNLSTNLDEPSTPESIEDEFLKQVASLTNSAEKKKDSSDQDMAGSSWDTLVHDLEKTLGLRTSVSDGLSAPEEDSGIEQTAEKVEASVKVDIVKPGEGKENQLPSDPQKQLEDPQPVSQARSSAKVEEKQKETTEMTKAERQAALARRPPRRSIMPGAIKPVSVEKKEIHPTVPPPVPPKTERRKPPVPSFSRKPPIHRKPVTASNEVTARSQATAQKPTTITQQPPNTIRKPPTTTRKPPSTARRPPTIARKLPPNRPRASTALMRPNTSVPPIPTVRRVSTPPTRPGQSSTAKTVTKPSTTQPSAASKPASSIPPKPVSAPRPGSAKPISAPKPSKAPHTPRQAAVIDAYRGCARAKKGDWSAKWDSLRNFEAVVKGLQGDSLPPRLCDDAVGLLGEYAQETHHKVQLSALDALFFLLLCSERPSQVTALHRALEKRPEILRRVLGLLKDGREDVRLACGRVMQSFEVLFGPEVQVALLVKAVSRVEGKIAEMGCVHMLKTFERAKQGDGFVWKAGVLESLVSLLASLRQNRRVEVRQGASRVLNAVKECLPDRAFEIVCKKVGVSV